jgi:hypothetical protein
MGKGTERTMMDGKMWLIRIPEVFSEWEGDVVGALGGGAGKRLGMYRMVRLPEGRLPRVGGAGIFVSWCLPVDHAWPCDPRKIEGFVEKAATGLQRKFGGRALRTVMVGTLEPGPSGSWFKRLASNLRGRALQLFPEAAMPLAEAGEQDPDGASLFCLVGKEGLYAGVATPRECNGFYPGGVRHLPRTTPETISRAGSKVAEALYQLRLYGEPPVAGGQWLELGASPGGMTSELLGRGFRVTAIDRAALDARLDGAEGLTFLRQDVGSFQPRAGESYDALLCDMNGDPRSAFGQVVRLSRFLKRDGWVIFTLKTAGSEGYAEMIALHEEIGETGARHGLTRVGTSHLSGNRREFTGWWRRSC